MITRQRLVTFGIPTVATATIVTAALLTTDGDREITPGCCVHNDLAGPFTTIPSHRVAGSHPIDVVFAVDTTGSMGGLLDGAKRTVWSIASHIRDTDPNADLRIGLVAYRDTGDDYITKPFSLTSDLDSVYGELASYTASGGGDFPEHVDAALDDSLHKMQWRADAKRLIFVVGDAPPHAEPRGGVPSHNALAREAADSGIVINTIRCGTNPEALAAFERIAQLGHGAFSTIEQDGGVQEIATPYDNEIATLSARIDRTTIIIGGETARQHYDATITANEAAPAAAKADRAAYYGKGSTGGMVRGTDDLVGGYATGDVDLGSVQDADLPTELRGKDKAEIKAEVERRVAERKELQAKITELSKQRTEYLSKQTKSDGFDAKVNATIEAQLK